MTASICISGLSKSVHGYRALDEIELNIEPGEMVAVIGTSTSGGSALLQNIAGLTQGDRDGTGSVEIFGRTVQCGGGLARDAGDIRTQIGLVLPQFNLVDRLSVIDNVLSGMLHRIPIWRRTFCQFTRDEVREGMLALERVGLARAALQRASTLSAGQQRRVAIARALAQQAKLILADEPMTRFDLEAERRVIETLASINCEDGTTIVVSLHRLDVAVSYCPRIVALRHGRIVYDGSSAMITPKMVRELYHAEADALLSDRPLEARSHDVPPLYLPALVPSPAHIG